MTTDITLHGATGYTGALTAEYLGTHLPQGATWAVAGRSRDKLRSVAEAVVAAGGQEPKVVVAELDDPASMRAMAEDTRVLISTVGPYLKHGMPAARAAAEAGIGYLDLTGEPQFVDEVWLELHETAEASGARLVHACGFDSIPYDLGVLYTVSQLPEDVPIQVKGYVRANLGPSGGTYHSAVNQFASLRESASVAKRRRAREVRPADRSIKGGGGLGRTEHDRGWAVPLPTIDPQVVLRSARALESYGPEFRYEHYAHVKTTRMLAAGALGLGVMGVGAQVPPLRALLLKAKSPGDGPTPEQRAKAWFTLDFLAESKDTRLHTRVSGRDPGYGGTGKMLSEAALCLAFDDLPPVAGQTTTAVAMGQALIDRLHPEILRFQTID
ncbi:saccharopine dehydrogenase family protein [Aeromicrobium sp. CF4.19]|uniref:saccharopine dehydrogenase family protein n=1 Tax=Aeromicrobium sp. CF4.19 TaxID=3373082 RepID=UPI003EE7AF64